MVALNPAYAPRKSIDAAKNRVGDFFCESVDRVGLNRLSAQHPRLENELSFTITASGLPYFINADPIGFAGGMNWYGYAGGNPISNIDPSGNVFGTPLTYGEFFGAAASGAAHGAKVYGKGLAVGAATGVVVVVVAGGVVVAVAVGVPTAVVTGTLVVAGGVGVALTGYSIYKDPSIDNITYNVGAITGAGIVGFGSARVLSKVTSVPGDGPPAAGWPPILGKAWKTEGGNGKISPLQWIKDSMPGSGVSPQATGPDMWGAAFSTTFGGSGLSNVSFK